MTFDPVAGIVTLSPQYFDSNSTGIATIRVSDSVMTKDYPLTINILSPSISSSMANKVAALMNSGPPSFT